MIGALDVEKKLIEFYGFGVTLDKVESCFRIAKEIIENLDAAAINELMGGDLKDIDALFDIIVRETFFVLYGDGKTVKSSHFHYLDKLTASIEETFRIESITYFATSVLNVDINWHHVEWGDLVEKRTHIAILAARDHGKSFYFSNIYPCWKMYRYKPQNNLLTERPDITHSKFGVLFSHTEDFAIELFGIITDTIKTSPLLSERLYNEKTFTKTEILTKNGSRLKAKGFLGGARGLHPGYIIVDDVLKDNVLYSPTQREKSREYFYSVVMNMLIPRGQIVVVGTPFHQQDLYSTFRGKDKSKTWAYREYPALFPDGTVLWPRRYTYQDLILKREALGNLTFSREMLCRPIVSESSIFPWEIISTSISGMDNYSLSPDREAFGKKFERIVMGCDFAISATVGADYTVFTVWGVTEEGEMWLLHCYRKQGASFNEQIAAIKRIYYDFLPDVVVMEDNNFQTIYTQFLKDTDIPVVGHKTGTNKHDLKNGLPGLTVLFERGKIRLPRGDKHSVDVTDVFLSEFGNITFTDKGLQAVSGHDDCVMSTWLARVGILRGTEEQFNFTFL